MFMACSLTLKQFSGMQDGDVNMLQAGLHDVQETVVGGEQEPCVEGSLQVS